jgi:predicted RNA-binding Zn-ribbon protein involved in translation (DUF1610 family)
MARPKGNYSLGDEPSRQPMRPAARGQIARNPSSDQKRQRRQMQRSADYTPGHVECQSCGYTGHPVLGDGTSANCAHCGSYSVHKPQQGNRPAPAYPENSRHLNKGDYGVTSSKTAYYDGGVDHDVDSENLTNACHAGEHSDCFGTHEDVPGNAKCLCRCHTSKTATVTHSKAWQLNPGDQIRLPNGRTQKVTRVRQHETSQGHVYVDTDGGRALAKRDDVFEVVPHNSAQLGTPGWGIPGGNTESTPGGTPHETAMAPSTQCPTCGRNGSLRREGDHYVCSHCGYREQFGGPSGHALTDSPRQYQVAAAYSTINGSTKSAVARRAEAMLNQKENQ